MNSIHEKYFIMKKIAIIIFLSLILFGCNKSNIFSDVPSSTLIIDGVSYKLNLMESIEGDMRPVSHATLGKNSPKVEMGFALDRFPTGLYIPIVGHTYREGEFEGHIAIIINGISYVIDVADAYFVGEKKGDNIVYTMPNARFLDLRDDDGDGYFHKGSDSIIVSGTFYVK